MFYMTLIEPMLVLRFSPGPTSCCCLQHLRIQVCQQWSVLTGLRPPSEAHLLNQPTHTHTHTTVTSDTIKIMSIRTFHLKCIIIIIIIQDSFLSAASTANKI